jgi:hypothetical protein
MESRDYESVVVFRERFRAMLAGLTASIPTAMNPLTDLDENQKRAAELLALCVQLGSILHCPALRVDEKSISAFQAALDSVISGIGEHAASLTTRCLPQLAEYGAALEECTATGIDEAESPRARMAAIAMAQCYGALVVEFLRKVEAQLTRFEPPHPQPWPVGFHL